MKPVLLSFLCFFLIFMIIDAIWLSYSIKRIYLPNLSSVPMNDRPKFLVGIVFYFIYVLGVTLIVLKPAIDNNSILQAFWTGAVFGIVAYGTYNLTNLVFIKNWSYGVTVLDMFWGGFLTSFSAASSVYFTKFFSS